MGELLSRPADKIILKKWSNIFVLKRLNFYENSLSDSVSKYANPSKRLYGGVVVHLQLEGDKSHLQLRSQITFGNQIVRIALQRKYPNTAAPKLGGTQWDRREPFRSRGTQRG